MPNGTDSICSYRVNLGVIIILNLLLIKFVECLFNHLTQLCTTCKIAKEKGRKAYQEDKEEKGGRKRRKGGEEGWKRWGKGRREDGGSPEEGQRGEEERRGLGWEARVF